MIAKFEKQISIDKGHTSICTYKNLHNLLHWHIEHELIFVDCGKVELVVNNKLYTLNSGTAAFIKGGEVHYIKGDTRSITHVIKTSALTILNILEQKQLECPVVKNDNSIEASFFEIKQELQNPKEYSGIIADSIITRMVAEIFRNETVLTEETVSKPNEKHKQLLEWISNNYTSITLEDAADYMNFSKSYFSKYFQNLSGMKFTQYINILKTSAAVEKIAERKMNMTEISISCGFGTIRNFNRVFKNITGYTPKSLPNNYIFLNTVKKGNDIGFDPTLNCSEIIA